MATGGKGRRRPAVSSKPGNAAALVARVESIDRLLQIRGAFERTHVAPDDSLESSVAAPVAEAWLHGSREAVVLVRLAFEYTVASAEARAPDEPPPESDPTRRLVARVDAIFLIAYRLSVGTRPKEADLHAFARANGVFNVTPFWREYLDSSLLRSGLPTAMAPLMKL